MDSDSPRKVHIQLGRIRGVRVLVFESFMIRMASQDPEKRRAEGSLRLKFASKYVRDHDIGKDRLMMKDSPPAPWFPYPFYQ